MPNIPKTNRPDGPDVNIGPSLIGLEWAFAGLAAIFLGLRLYTVSVILRRVRTADYLMILAFICAVVQGSILTASYKWGLGRHFYYLNDEQRFYAMKFAFLLEGWGIASAMFGRISFCLFMIYIVGENRYMRPSLWFSIISQAVVNIATIILIYSQCGSHPQALWNPRIHAQCLSPQAQTNFSYFQSAWNSLTDLFLTVLPATVVMGLNMNLTRRFLLTILLGLSLFALIASLIKAYEIKQLSNRGDFTWALAKLHYYAVTENYIIIIIASAPPLNALFRRSQRSTKDIESYKMGASKQIVAQTTWTKRREPLYTTAEDDSKEKILASSQSFTGGAITTRSELKGG